MNSGLDGEKNFCGRFSHQCRIINNRNQWPMAKTVDINTDAKGFVRNLSQKGVRNLIPRQGCQVSRWFDILREASCYRHYMERLTHDYYSRENFTCVT